MSSQWSNPNITSLQWSTKKPDNPIDGDSYFDKKTNKVYHFSKGVWIEYQLYIPETKNHLRINKIKNLFK